MSIPESLAITKDVQQLRTGNLILDFYSEKSDLFLSWEHQDEERSSFQVSPLTGDNSDKKWKRWIVKDMSELFISPRLPELPLVVKPSSELYIQPGASITLYVEIPLTLVCSSSQKSTHSIVEIDTEKLKKTWFGESTSGELCYLLKTGINTELPDQRYEHHAIAPVTVNNDAHEQLNMKRFSLDMNSFNLYRGSDGYWTDHQVVRFRGSVSQSQIRILGKPAMADSLQLVSAGRRKALTDFVRKSFDTFLFPRGF